MSPTDSERPFGSPVACDRLVQTLSQLPGVQRLNVSKLGVYRNELWLIIEMDPPTTTPHAVCQPIDRVRIDSTAYTLDYTTDAPFMDTPFEITVYDHQACDVVTGLEHLQEFLTTCPDTSLPPGEWAAQLIAEHGLAEFFIGR